MLDQGGAAVGLPAARLEHKEGFERASHIVRRRRDLERDRPVLGETIVLPAQFLQLLGSKRVAQQLFGIGRGVETGALFGAQHDGAKVLFRKRDRERICGRALDRHMAQHDGMGAACACLRQQGARGIDRRAAVDQRRGEIAIRIGRDEDRQRQPEGAPGGDDRQQRGEGARSVATAQCEHVGPSARGCVDRRFPIRQEVAVRLDRVPAQGQPVGRRERAQRPKRTGVTQRRGQLAVGRARNRTALRLPRMRGVADLHHVPFPATASERVRMPVAPSLLRA